LAWRRTRRLAIVLYWRYGLYRITRQRQIEKLTDETNRSWFPSSMIH
jgi:hypothetical protein